MSQFDVSSLPFSEIASEITARCLDAIEGEHFKGISNEELGQVFAAILRVFAAKAQNGEVVRPFGRNSSVTPTDVAIGCTAMLESVNIAVFELGAWQSMSGVGRLSH